MPWIEYLRLLIAFEISDLEIPTLIHLGFPGNVVQSSSVMVVDR